MQPTRKNYTFMTDYTTTDRFRTEVKFCRDSSLSSPYKGIHQTIALIHWKCSQWINIKLNVVTLRNMLEIL